MAWGQNERKVIRQGLRAYNDGEFSEAEVQFRKAGDINQESFEAEFNTGTALYGQEKYEETVKQYTEILKDSNTIMLNGPAGVFEDKNFSYGTYELFKAIADSDAYSVIGGGHTSAVVEELGIADHISHVSTGGGALIEFLSGRDLPVIEALKASKLLYEAGHYEV